MELELVAELIELFGRGMRKRLLKLQTKISTYKGGEMIQKTKVKKVFNRAGLQISPDALEQLDYEVGQLVDKWVANTKFGNIKRLTGKVIWAALGRYNNR